MKVWERTLTLKSYKYLGVNNELDWSDNTKELYKKGQSRLSAKETQILWSANISWRIMAKLSLQASKLKKES